MAPTPGWGAPAASTQSWARAPLRRRCRAAAAADGRSSQTRMSSRWAAAQTSHTRSPVGGGRAGGRVGGGAHCSKGRGRGDGGAGPLGVGAKRGQPAEASVRGARACCPVEGAALGAGERGKARLLLQAPQARVRPVDDRIEVDDARHKAPELAVFLGVVAHAAVVGQVGGAGGRRVGWGSARGGRSKGVAEGTVVGEGWGDIRGRRARRIGPPFASHLQIVPCLAPGLDPPKPALSPSPKRLVGVSNVLHEDGQPRHHPHEALLQHHGPLQRDHVALDRLQGSLAARRIWKGWGTTIEVEGAMRVRRHEAGRQGGCTCESQQSRMRPQKAGPPATRPNNSRLRPPPRRAQSAAPLSRLWPIAASLPASG